ncbi:MAG: CPBP family intramembrane metalloprotease [Lachnospiraceae bacterium]|nr:CPBP family intramembrane metalloprotease [Lachnospiraceae bacterium]
MDNNNIILNADAIKAEKKKYFANFMWKLIVCIAVIYGVQIILSLPMWILSGVFEALRTRLHGDFIQTYSRLADNGTVNTIESVLSYVILLISDGIGTLTLFLLTKKSHAAPEKKNMKFGYWFVAFMCCFGIGGVGSVIGSILNVLLIIPGGICGGLVKALGFLSAPGPTNVVDNLLYADDSWIYLIFGVITVGIVAPIFEELIFRKIFIDSTSKYGFAASVLLSALAFGIFHGNFVQFFYATGLGILFGYIYAATGKLRYTIFLHMGYNLYAALIMPFARKLIPSKAKEEMQMATDFLTKRLETVQTWEEMGRIFRNYSDYMGRITSRYPTVIPGMILVTLVTLFYLLLILIGIILAIVFLKKALNYRKTMMLGQKGTKPCAAFNWGSILFWVLGGGIFILYYLLLNIASFIGALGISV